MRQGRNHDVAVFPLIYSPHSKLPGTGLVHGEDFFARCNDLCGCWQIRPLNKATQILGVCFRVVKKVDACLGRFDQVMGGDVCGHAHGNARSAVEQQIWQSGRQSNRFIEGSIKIRLPINGSLP